MQDETQMPAEMRVHPAANCFRMMREDELAALVEDIRENGLRDPITLGRVASRDFDELVDGRNRLHACEAAGIEPHFETRQFKDDDAVRAFVRSRSARRDLTKGERAAALALLDLNPVKGKHRDRSSAEIADEATHTKDASLATRRTTSRL
jgi:ParB-like chromosome segregation protein Spo0J